MKGVMNRIFKAVLLSAALVSVVSCMVEESRTSHRTKYALMDYAECSMGSIYLFEPVMAVVLASDADIYLSLSEEDRKDFDIDSLFPEGLRHIDGQSINIPDLASIYSDGTSFGTAGAHWTVHLQPGSLGNWYAPYWNYYHFSSGYSNVSMELECLGEGIWTVTERQSDNNSGTMEDADITVRLEDSQDGVKTFVVNASGRFVEEDGLYAGCSTSDDGVRVTYSLRTLSPLSGTFHVSFFKDGRQVDFCDVTYTPDGAVFDVSIDED